MGCTNAAIYGRRSPPCVPQLQFLSSMWADGSQWPLSQTTNSGGKGLSSLAYKCLPLQHTCNNWFLDNIYEHDPHWMLSPSSSRVQHYSVQSHCRQLPGRFGDFSAAFIHRDKFSFSWAHKRLFSWLVKAGIHSAIERERAASDYNIPFNSSLHGSAWCLKVPQQSTPWKPLCSEHHHRHVCMLYSTIH